jgi:hypothetical protein
MIKPIHYTIFLIIAISHPANAQRYNRSNRPDTLNRYLSITLLTSVEWQYRTGTSGTLGVTVPYTATSASGTTTSNTFASQPKRVYSPNQLVWGAFGFEVGDLHHCISSSLSIVLREGYLYGYSASAGYGRVWYLNGCRPHNTKPQLKTFILKAMLNLSYYIDEGDHGVALLGRIDNANQTLNILGHQAGPTYNISASRYGPGGTYNAKNLDLSYGQSHWSLIPAIALSTNPFRHRTTFELDLGYVLPFANRGGVYLTQDDGSVTSHNINYIGGEASLKNTAITATFNGKPIRSAPYRLGGPYAAFKINLAECSKKRKSH